MLFIPKLITFAFYIIRGMKALFLLLGSNLGDRKVNISKAVDLISAEIGRVVNVSSCYETEPWGKSDQGLFLNQAIQVFSIEDPYVLLDRLLMIEQKLGRSRTCIQNEARVIDIDILFYGNTVVSSETLEIPHPRFQLRRFALTPMCEIAPDLVHPAIGLPICQLLNECEDKLSVRMFDEVVNF